MFKILLILLLSMNLSALDNNLSDNMLLTTTIIIISGIGGVAIAVGEDIAFTYAMLAGEDKFNRVIKSLQ